MGAHCDIEDYLVVTEVRDRQSVREQAAQKFYIKRFNLKKLNEEKVREQYQINISHRFAVLKNL
jgi:hypothetical protein